jgi:tetratricopeptide (TPR) repeat protein
MPDHDPTRTADPTATGADECARGAVAAPAGYELLGEVGRGGMGVVYRSRDLALGREVAVKVLSERYSPDSRTAARFVEEARITGQLQHPGIPAVHQAGALPDGRPFLAMKLIKGRTLEDRLKDARAGAGDNLAVFEAVCQAVAYAHSKGVIHRDLKPANVMVGAFGEVQVMDWGLAKLLSPASRERQRPEAAETIGTEIRSLRDSDGSFTQAGSTLGTPAYMPPEQAAGESDKIDRRSDVFGLGAILCVMLTGQPPFTGKDADEVRLNSVRGKLAECFARLDGCGAEPDLVALAKHCLAAEPDGRPADAGEVAQAVAGLRADAEERARRAELDRAKAEVRADEQRKRRRVQAALAATAAVGLAAVAGGLWWADRQATARLTERRAEADRNRQAAGTALDQAEKALGKTDPAYGEIDAALGQAKQRLEAGGAEDLRPRFDGFEKDRRMLQRLDEIDQRRWMPADDRRSLDTAYAREHYPRAFREYGLDPAVEPPAMLAEKVRRSPISARLKAALDAWLAVSGGNELLALLNALDPNPDRSALRLALAVNDGKAISGLVEKLDGRRLPPDFAEVVGGHPKPPDDQCRRILRDAQAAHPSHFGLAMQTARRALLVQPAEAVAYYRIALAIRPTSAVGYNNLSSALSRQGDLDGAIDACRRAVGLDPRLARAHYNLGVALRLKKEYGPAAEAFRESVRLDPGYAPTHYNLGLALQEVNQVDGAVAAFREAIRLGIDRPAAYLNLSAGLIDRGEALAALEVIDEASRHNPAWLADSRNRFRFNAACAAVLAATGQARDAPPEAERPALRRKALESLTADLAGWRSIFANDPAARATVHTPIAAWLSGTTLAPVREPNELAKLPADERAEWEKLWAGVRQLRDETAPQNGSGGVVPGLAPFAIDSRPVGADAGMNDQPRRGGSQ